VNGLCPLSFGCPNRIIAIDQRYRMNVDIAIHSGEEYRSEAKWGFLLIMYTEHIADLKYVIIEDRDHNTTRLFDPPV
jgi:hypothetical protein